MEVIIMQSGVEAKAAIAHLIMAKKEGGPEAPSSALSQQGPLEQIWRNLLQPSSKGFIVVATTGCG